MSIRERELVDKELISLFAVECVVVLGHQNFTFFYDPEEEGGVT